MWDAHSVFLVAICVYTEKMDPFNPWVQIRDELLYAQISNGDMKFTYLETYVFVMKRLKASRDGRFVLKGLVQHYTSGAVIGAVGIERTKSWYGSRRERSHSCYRAGLRGVAATTMVVVKVLAWNVLTARTVVGTAVRTAVGMAVRTAVRMAVGTVVGRVVKNDARTVRGIVVVVIRRPGDALAVRTIFEKAVRIGDGIGSRDIAVGVLLINILVTPIIHHAVPGTGQRIAMTSAVRAEVHRGRGAAQGVAHRKPTPRTNGKTVAVPYVLDVRNEAICNTIVLSLDHMVVSAFGSRKRRLASSRKLRFLETTGASIPHLFFRHRSPSKKSKVRGFVGTLTPGVLNHVRQCGYAVLDCLQIFQGLILGQFRRWTSHP